MKIRISIGIVSAAAIAFQLVMIQTLSLVQWYHFACMIISVALLGFGVSGTFLTLFRAPLMKRWETVMPCSMILSGVFMALTVPIMQTAPVRFDSYLVFVNWLETCKLGLTYLTLALPFFFGALAIGMFFIREPEGIGVSYFFNLAGSAAGGILMLCLIPFFPPQQLALIVSALPLVSGLMILPVKGRLRFYAVAFSFLAWSFSFMLMPARLELSEFKDLSKTLNMPDTRVVSERNSHYGLIQAVSSPYMRWAPGLSLNFRGTIPSQKAVFSDGNWIGPLMPLESLKESKILDCTADRLPYEIARIKTLLVLSSGTGTMIANGIANGVPNIDGVEENGALTEMLMDEFSAETGGIFRSPLVKLHTVEARTFIMSTGKSFDLIVLPFLGAFSGATGLQSIRENYLLTREAFGEMWRRLESDGMIAVSCWMDYPPRCPLRLLATIVEMLGENGISEPAENIVAIRSWSSVTFVVGKSGFSSGQVEQVRSFCGRMSFDPLILPGTGDAERNRFNQMPDSLFFEHVDRILSPGRESLYADYDFAIAPATDDRPYFFQFLRWKTLPRLGSVFGNWSLPFFETGYVLVLAALAQTLLASLVLIILPLFRLGWKPGGRLFVLLYFGGIGLAYMFVEIIFIQRFVLYFGSPVYAAAMVIALMLACSGAGSLCAHTVKSERACAAAVFPAIIALALAALLLSDQLLRGTIGAGFSAKLATAMLVIGPISFCMGFPFPLGIRLLAKSDCEHAIPWAWGVNCCVSVVSSVLAVIIAVECGFKWIMVAAAFSYAVSCAAVMCGILRGR